jgi:nucleoid DNA-binding protein
MPTNLNELARMIARRDGISLNEAYAAINETADLLNDAIAAGSITMAEEILLGELGIELDYLDLFL